MAKTYSMGRCGKTGHSYTGLMEYRHRPNQRPDKSIPDNFRPDLKRLSKDPSNFSRTRLNVPGLGGM